MKDLVLEYVESRSSLKESLKNVETKQSNLHRELRETIEKDLDEWPQWLREECKKYLVEVTPDQLERLFFVFGAYLESSETAAHRYSWIHERIRETICVDQAIDHDLRHYRSMLLEMNQNLTRMNAYAVSLHELDPDVADEIFNSVREARLKHGTTLIVNSERVDRLADRVDFTEVVLESMVPSDAPLATTVSLAGYSNRQRQVIELRSEGYSLSEVAEMLGVKPGTVHQHSHIAKKKFDGLQVVMCL